MTNITEDDVPRCQWCLHEVTWDAETKRFLHVADSEPECECERPPDLMRCPVCAIEAGVSRQDAWDMHFGPSVENVNPVRRITRTFTSDRADPTETYTLSCGHTVI